MATIGIMDSGVGGLSVLREILGVLPQERYLYYSDNANCPYGDKSREFIRDRCRQICRHFISQGARAMVLACNTATAAAITSLREEFGIPFVGMEPAVKPAVQSTRSGVVGVLATAGTLSGDKYHSTRDRYSGHVKIVERVGKGFVELVEKGELEGRHAEEVVRASLQPLLDAGADTIVLGCTHYPFLLGTMKAIAGNGVDFVDPAPAVAHHLREVLEAGGIALSDADPGVVLEASGDDGALRKAFSRLRPQLPLR